MCGSLYGINTHHIDWNHQNNKADNLTVVCHHCHEQAHKLGKPLFDELIQRVAADPYKKEKLRTRSVERHWQLYSPLNKGEAVPPEREGMQGRLL